MRLLTRTVSYVLDQIYLGQKGLKGLMYGFINNSSIIIVVCYYYVFIQIERFRIYRTFLEE